MLITRYVNDLQTVFEGEPWYGKSVLAIASKISVDHLDNSLPNGNTVLEILRHIIVWRKWCIEMCIGNYNYWIKADSTQDWDRSKTTKQDELSALITELKETQTALIQAIKNKSDDWIDTTIPERKCTFGDAVNGVIQHDIYHIGQIALFIK